MPGYEVYLHVGLLEAIAKGGVELRNILDFVYHLRANPNAPGDFTEKDDTLRVYQVKSSETLR